MLWRASETDLRQLSPKCSLVGGVEKPLDGAGAPRVPAGGLGWRGLASQIF